MIYLIITTSINNKVGVVNFNHRENRYSECIASALKLTETEGEPKIKTIVVENNGSRSTYLDKFNCDIIYTDNNKNNYIHKGVNELLDIKDVISKYDIDDDDIIIKLTGRYKLLNNHFIQLVINNVIRYDAFIKFFNVCTETYMEDDCVLGLYAVKCKYLKAFNYNCKKSPECEFAIFITNNIDKGKIMEVTTLGLECCFADDLRKIIC
jgi:hypothetical protein